MPSNLTLLTMEAAVMCMLAVITASTEFLGANMTLWEVQLSMFKALQMH